MVRQLPCRCARSGCDPCRWIADIRGDREKSRQHRCAPSRPALRFTRTHAGLQSVARRSRRPDGLHPIHPVSGGATQNRHHRGRPLSRPCPDLKAPPAQAARAGDTAAFSAVRAARRRCGQARRRMPLRQSGPDWRRNSRRRLQPSPCRFGYLEGVASTESRRWHSVFIRATRATRPLERAPSAAARADRLMTLLRHPLPGPEARRQQKRLDAVQGGTDVQRRPTVGLRALAHRRGTDICFSVAWATDRTCHAVRRSSIGIMKVLFVRVEQIEKVCVGVRAPGGRLQAIGRRHPGPGVAVAFSSHGQGVARPGR